MRNAPYREHQDASSYIDYVDYAIRNHIIALNENRFVTVESCSGLPKDHPDRDPYRPYVMLDERAYPNCIPHFFTLANIADWIPSYAPHNFDIYLRAKNNNSIEESWNRLAKSAELLHSLLKPYHSLLKSAASESEITTAHHLEYTSPKPTRKTQDEWLPE
jgi:hypothetical protein